MKKAKNISQFYIQINDRGGKHFRKYTKDTLQMLFDTSPTAANFELMIIIEGLVFFALRIHFIINKNGKAYEQFIKENDSLARAIKKLSSKEVMIIDEVLEEKLTIYRKMRNDISHNLFRMKSFNSKSFPIFKDYSYSQALNKLFYKGLEIFDAFSEFMIPGHPSQKVFTQRFKGVSKSVVNNKKLRI